jgi:small-conductance mechanosensitive channel
VLHDVRAMLAGHAKVLQPGLRVSFVRIGADAQEIEIFAYIDTVVWSRYLEIVEQLNMRVLESIAAAGASLALPAQSLFVEQA